MKMNKETAPALLLEKLVFTAAADGPLHGRTVLQTAVSGCNLRCRGCRYRLQQIPALPRSVEEILSRHRERPELPLLLCGGEPLLQTAAVHRLLERTLQEGREMLLKTNGSIDISTLPREWPIQLDCKSPGSGMSGVNNFENLRTIKRRKGFLSIQLHTEEDPESVLNLLQEYKLLRYPHLQLYTTTEALLNSEKKARFLEAGFRGELLIKQPD